MDKQLTFWLVILAVVWLPADIVEGRSSEKLVPFAQCFQDNELRESFATLKRQAGLDVGRVYEFLRAKAKTTAKCRAQLVQALISAMEQATDMTDPMENYFFWDNGASLLGDLKATEALDLLIANIDLSSGYESSLNDFPALVAILKIGKPAFPKLQIVLRNDSVPYRRKFVAFAIAYIGGRQAKRILTRALPSETDPCVNRFLRLSVQAMSTKEKPNHISPALAAKWHGAFFCRSSSGPQILDNRDQTRH